MKIEKVDNETLKIIRENSETIELKVLRRKRTNLLKDVDEKEAEITKLNTQIALIDEQILEAENLGIE